MNFLKQSQKLPCFALLHITQKGKCQSFSKYTKSNFWTKKYSQFSPFFPFKLWSPFCCGKKVIFWKIKFKRTKNKRANFFKFKQMQIQQWTKKIFLCSLCSQKRRKNNPKIFLMQKILVDERQKSEYCLVFSLILEGKRWDLVFGIWYYLFFFGIQGELDFLTKKLHLLWQNILRGKIILCKY